MGYDHTFPNGEKVLIDGSLDLLPEVLQTIYQPISIYMPYILGQSRVVFVINDDYLAVSGEKTSTHRNILTYISIESRPLAETVAVEGTPRSPFRV